MAGVQHQWVKPGPAATPRHQSETRGPPLHPASFPLRIYGSSRILRQRVAEEGTEGEGVHSGRAPAEGAEEVSEATPGAAPLLSSRRGGRASGLGGGGGGRALGSRARRAALNPAPPPRRDGRGRSALSRRLPAAPALRTPAARSRPRPPAAGASRPRPASCSPPRRWQPQPPDPEDYERTMRRLRRRAIAALLLLLPLLPAPGLGARDPVGALRWRGSPQVGIVEAREVTEPSRLVGESSGGEVRKQQLDTRVRQEPPGGPPVHLAQVSFVIPAFNSNFTLDLELNHHLLSSKYVERHFSREGITQHSTGAGDHCYYQGKLRDSPHSFAAISTCRGLHGVFSDGNLTYIVEPQEMAGPWGAPQGPLPHLIYRTPLLPAPLGCREPGCLFADPAHSAPPNRPRLRRKRQAGEGWDTLQWRLALSPAAVQTTPHTPSLPWLGHEAKHGGTDSKCPPTPQVRRGHPTVHSETKYVELIVINDHQLFEQMRQSVVLTSNFAKSVVNLADVIYKEQLNTRIVLVAMETWADGDKIQVQDDLLETLARLMVYRREGLPEPSDATHLFSGRTFQSTSSGAAYVGGICSLSRGGGVNEYGNMGAMAVTLAQTLGQNLGMMWNKHRSSAGDCKCPDIWLGCIMEDTGFYLPRKFSRCSIDEYNQFLQEGGGSCLFNKPLKLLDPPECGNGFVEAGEECDCGSVQVSGLCVRQMGPGRRRWARGRVGVGRIRTCPLPSATLGDPQECSRAGGNCCKKCTLTHDAMCSDGLCCRRCKVRKSDRAGPGPRRDRGTTSDKRRQGLGISTNERLGRGVRPPWTVESLALRGGMGYEPRGVSCREAVNECDIAETCTGDSSQVRPAKSSYGAPGKAAPTPIGLSALSPQCPPNLHKLDGYYCDHEQGRCYGGRCKTRDRQCQALWGHVAADRFCYEKLNVEGTERGNCGRKGSGWVQCNKQDVLCGFLLCVNISGAPRLGDLGGDISSVTFYHQGKELDCRGGHVQLADGSDLSYVEDGTACGPNMLCLDHRCLPASAFNFSTCPGSGERRICSHHGVCSNEGKCICQPDWTGKDCSIHNPLPTSPPTGETERYKGPSGTNIIIGSIAGAVLVAAIVLGGTGWGFK
ncbi:Hypothetical predicted protein [Marmota monax]|uniref:EGF-like domain-containing protein n=1 Tax=Marmota monax TaxID=9995 RepID=A0A5E4BBP6_MARMO|nr:Hypothetical predicted protein [Marmota monax]